MGYQVESLVPVGISTFKYKILLPLHFTSQGHNPFTMCYTIKNSHFRLAQQATGQSPSIACTGIPDLHHLVSWCPISHPAPYLCTDKAVKVAQNLGNLHLCGRLGGGKALDSWFQIRSSPIIAATWGVKQRMEDLSVAPSYKSAFPINKSFKKKYGCIEFM